MKKLLILLLLFSSASVFASRKSLDLKWRELFLGPGSQDAMEFYENVQEFYNELNQELDLRKAAKNKVFLIGDVLVEWGPFANDVGGGGIYAEINEDNLFKSLKIDVTVGILGYNQRIQNSMNVESLKAGKTLTFTMGKNTSRVTLKITPIKGFTDQGGDASIEFYTGNNTYKKETIKIWPSTKGEYFIWKNNKVVKGVSVHMKGASISSMYVSNYNIN